MLDWLVNRMVPAPQDLLWAAPSLEVAREPDLERRIRTDPDDREALSVYADFLAESGDARGAVLAAWLVATGPEIDTALSAQVDRWVEAYARPLTRQVRHTGGTPTFAGAFNGPLLDRWHRSPRGAIELAPILEAPECVALRSVGVTCIGAGSVPGWLSHLEARKHPCPLQEVHLQWITIKGLDFRARWPALRGLSTVILRGNLGELGKVFLPEVEVLELGDLTAMNGLVPLDGFLAPRLRELRLGLVHATIPFHLILPVCPDLMRLTVRAPSVESFELLVEQLTGRFPLAQLRLIDSSVAMLQRVSPTAAERISSLVIEYTYNRPTDVVCRQIQRHFGDRCEFIRR